MLIPQVRPEGQTGISWVGVRVVGTPDKSNSKFYRRHKRVKARAHELGNNSVCRIQREGGGNQIKLERLNHKCLGC